MPKGKQAGALWWAVQARDEGLRSTLKQSAKALRDYDRSVKDARGSMRRAGAQFRAFRNSVLSARGAVGALAGAAGIGLMVKRFAEAADVMTLAQSRLKLVTEGTNELRQAQANLFAVSQQTGGAYENVVNLYARVARATKQLGVDQQQLLTFTRAVNQSLVVSGATAAEAGAGLIQLAQGLASNRLGGDELRSVMEQLPRLARAIADDLDVPIGKIRELSRAGKLTAEVVFGALVRQAPKIAQEFVQVERTVQRALTELRNQYLQVVEAVNRGAGATKDLIAAIDEAKQLLADPEFQKQAVESVTFFAQGFKFLLENVKAITLFFGGTYLLSLAVATKRNLETLAAVQGLSKGFDTFQKVLSRVVGGPGLVLLGTNLRNATAAAQGLTGVLGTGSLALGSLALGPPGIAVAAAGAGLLAFDQYAKSVKEAADRTEEFQKNFDSLKKSVESGVSSAGDPAETVKAIQREIELLDLRLKALRSEARALQPKNLGIIRAGESDEEKQLRGHIANVEGLSRGLARQKEVLEAASVSVDVAKRQISSLDSVVESARKSLEKEIATNPAGSEKGQRIREYINYVDQLIAAYGKATTAAKSLTPPKPIPENFLGNYIASLDQGVELARQELELVQATGAERLKLQAQFKISNDLTAKGVQFSSQLEDAQKKLNAARGGERESAQAAVNAAQAQLDAFQKTVAASGMLTAIYRERLTIQQQAAKQEAESQALRQAGVEHQQFVDSVLDATRQLEQEAAALTGKAVEQTAEDVLGERKGELEQSLRYARALEDPAAAAGIEEQLGRLKNNEEEVLKIVQDRLDAEKLIRDIRAEQRTLAEVKRHSLESFDKEVELEFKKLENANKLAGLRGKELFEMQQLIKLKGKEAALVEALIKARKESNDAEIKVIEEILEAVKKRLRVGKALTDEQRKRADNLQREKDLIEQQKKTMEERKKLAQDISQTLTKGMEDAILGAKSFKEALKGVLDELARILLRAAILKPLEGFLTGAIGGLFGVPGKAAGGPVEAGRAYIVGEGGRPELFVPSVGGEIIPNYKLRPALAGGGGMVVSFGDINIESTDGPGVRAAMAEAIPVIENRLSRLVSGQVQTNLSRPSPLRGIR